MPVGYSFDDLKDFTGLDIHTKPPDGRAADFHFIYLAGDEVIAKRQEASTVVATKLVDILQYLFLGYKRKHWAMSPILHKGAIRLVAPYFRK